MNVAVLPNLDKRGSADMVEKIGAFFKSEGITAYLPDNICCPNYNSLPEDELFKIADCLVTIGGDGTIIRYAKRAALDGKPIVGINAGRVGYLANIEQSEYRLLGKLKTREFTIERRMMLNISVVENGRCVGSYYALNDAVIASGYVARIIDVTASVDGDSINYFADGVIVSTPTGSTAYSMAAGGPIIDPTTECMCLTPICSHSLRAKPLVFSPDAQLEITSKGKNDTRLYLTVDGNENYPLSKGDSVRIARSEISTKLIRIKKDSFFSVLNQKMSEY